MRSGVSSKRVMSRKKILRGKAKAKKSRGQFQSMRDKGCPECGAKCSC